MISDPAVADTSMCLVKAWASGRVYPFERQISASGINRQVDVTATVPMLSNGEHRGGSCPVTNRRAAFFITWGFRANYTPFAADASLFIRYVQCLHQTFRIPDCVNMS
jgi:hypothetical protein